MIFLMKKNRIRGMIYQKVISVTITDVFLFQGGRDYEEAGYERSASEKLTKAGALALAAVVAMGGGVTYYNSQNQVPELITYVDTDGSIEIPDEDVPLAAPKVTKSTKTKKKVKKIKMKKASKKTYKKAGKTVTKKKKKVKSSKKNVTTTETLTATNVTNAYKKGSKIDTRVTTVKTTVIKTVAPTGIAAATGTATTTATKATTAGTASAAQNGEIAITQIAPLVSGNVTSAFQKLGFKIVINSGVSYSGLCDARTRTVTLKRADNTVYHELGHFVAFVAGNIDTSSAFQSIYNREKSLYTDYNKAYVLSSSSEYFAESYKNYILNPTQLKNSRPETYAAIENALSRVTDAQASRILSVYGALWNK